MRMRTALLATALMAMTANYAFAQNTGSPANEARPGEQGSDSSKPNGLQNNAGTGLPAKMGQPGPDGSGRMTTGSGVSAGGGMSGGMGSAESNTLTPSRGGSGSHHPGDTTGVDTTGHNTNISPGSARKGE